VKPRVQIAGHSLEIVRRQDDPPAAGPLDEVVEMRGPFDIDVLGPGGQRVGEDLPPIFFGALEATITGRLRPSSAPATLGSLTESSRSSMRSASSTASRRRRSSAMVAAETVTQSEGFVIIKKPLQPFG
jgi:hypothetical protein